jgi:hypothetical protein
MNASPASSGLHHLEYRRHPGRIVAYERMLLPFSEGNGVIIIIAEDHQRGCGFEIKT